MNTSALILSILTQGIVLAVTVYCFILVLRKPKTDK
jgi:hypothetical protein